MIKEEEATWLMRETDMPAAPPSAGPRRDTTTSARTSVTSGSGILRSEELEKVLDSETLEKNAADKDDKNEKSEMAAKSGTVMGVARNTQGKQESKKTQDKLNKQVGVVDKKNEMKSEIGSFTNPIKNSLYKLFSVKFN